MATSPSKRFVRALAIGLALAGAALVGPGPLVGSAGHASASALVGGSAHEAPPPPPDPVPIIDREKARQAKPGPDNQSPQPQPRSQHGDPVG
jgi:hypothetical protein